MKQEEQQDIEYGVCTFCHGVSYCIRSEIVREKPYPFAFPCPMCNPHNERPPVEADRKYIDDLIEERKKVVPKETP